MDNLHNWYVRLRQKITPYAYYRHRAVPASKGQYRVVIQIASRFPFLLMPRWRDCVPVENYQRRLEHEALWCAARLRDIIETEHPNAVDYVKQSYKQLEEGNLRRGKGTPFRDDWVDREELMPDASGPYKDLVKSFRKSQDPHGIEGGGPKTAFVLPGHDIFHNREELGAKYDHIVPFRQPNEQKSQSRKGQPRPNQNN